ncbi:alanine/glycine:cation symporter family protein [Brevibacterium jeotgali]|uniref:Alanine or glycine:cation symporter, AGCS family n=1 Tax=Brevibacterium jeotgali TaxID=1262550 RepID=A0A2H1L5A4_9MICO|nr:alanine/glycine:cation symporter family protein [Brevibacterium jeotgali]TWC01817.1 AGCS family alanine or glycine:cation symporter [Brevibacterium jeotgali]SMY11563.1 alanine or glycine:cation symporter, AGCS family [Brevibacterium jeotgali]
MDPLLDLITSIDSFLGYVLVAVLIPVGLYLTIRTGIVQLRLLPEMFRLIREPAGHDADGKRRISPFRAFCISAASRVGTANITGVALAISIGGPGAIFWMWVTAAIGGATAFAESALGQLYKVKDGASFRGGPAYYITHGLKAPVIGALFAVIVAVVYGIVFNTVQSNSITDALAASFGAEASGSGFAILVGLIIAAAAGIIVVGGVHRISAITSVIVPVMAVLYLVLGIIVVVLNLDAVPGMLATIVSEALGFQSIAGAALGSIMMEGIRRGLFSNEAGIGSVPNAAATASASHPAKQGLVQSLGVYFDTLLVCSITGFIVLLSNPEYGAPQGSQLTQTALAAQVGQWGVHFLTFAIFFFAFSSILGNYYYGQTNIEYLTKSRAALNGYRLVVVVAVFFGSVVALDAVWTAANIAMALMAFINLIAVLLLSRTVLRILRDYQQQRQEGVEPLFHKDRMGDLDGLDAWDGTDEVTQTQFWQKRSRR